MPDRWILHMDLDSFFVSVERILNPDLVGKPVIVGGNSKRGVVSSCSYEARQVGVKSAMPTSQAYQLCPNGIFVNGSREAYTHYSALVTDIIRENTPLFEKASIDEFYIDLTGMDKHFGAAKHASFLRQKIIEETGLPISFGLASSKTVAKIATGEGKPNGEFIVPQGEEKSFLGPLQIKKIPMAGKRACDILLKAGLTRIKNLQQQPLKNIESMLGKSGNTLWHKAQGIDHSSIIPYRERKSISAERTFEESIYDHKELEDLLHKLVEKTASQLRKENKLTTTLAIKIRFDDFKTKSLQRKVPPTAADHIIFPIIKNLLSDIHTNQKPLRLIGIRFGDLVNEGQQVGLFHEQEEKEDLYKAIDTIRNKFGKGSITRNL